MRILLSSSASHRPPRGGSTRSNLAWLDRLTAGGHECRVVGGALSSGTPEKAAQVRRETEDQQVDGAALVIHAVADPIKRGAVLKEQIRDWQPDWVLISSEDIGQSLLAAAHEAAPGRVVYLAHTPQFYPFGPASWNLHREGADLVARSAAVVAIGHHTAEYIFRHIARRADVIHPPVYGSGPFAQYGALDGGFVTMINPCAVKGISIFLALVKKFPACRFAALPGWGTTVEDRSALEAHTNVTLLRNCKDIDEVLKETRILLVPSLWFEGFGLVVVEAMLRGIPVVSSDAGGLVEAKLGTQFVIPVRPIEKYEAVFDDQGLPRAVLPRQDFAPWAEALETLLTDRELLQRESVLSREAALGFSAALQPERFEQFLLALSPGERVAHEGAALDRLSPDKRALLLRRLRARAPQGPGRA